MRRKKPGKRESLAKRGRKERSHVRERETEMTWKEPPSFRSRLLVGS
jgi:hypothetical protein